MTPQQEIQFLKDRLSKLEGQFNRFAGPSFYRMGNPIIGDTDGLSLGITARDKIGLFGVNPIVQPSTSGTTGNESVGGGVPIPDGTAYKGYTNSGTAYTPQDIVGALKALGILAP